jgi:hypothetical protein
LPEKLGYLSKNVVSVGVHSEVLVLIPSAAELAVVVAVQLKTAVGLALKAVVHVVDSAVNRRRLIVAISVTKGVVELQVEPEVVKVTKGIR